LSNYTDYSNPAGTYDGTILVEYHGNPRFNRSDGSRSYVYKYWCLTSLAHDGSGGLIPARFSAKTINGLDHYLVGATADEQSDPNFSDITLRYNRSGTTADPIRSEGDIERRVENIAMEKKEEVGTGQFETKKFWGVEYEYSETVENFLWSEANILKDIALLNISRDLGDPTGLSGIAPPVPPSLGNWIFVGKSSSETPMQNDGAGGYTPSLTTHTEVWRYSPKGWEGVILS
jgi:hypothetical protein